ncbi:MAG: FAD-dependent oxidoreductase [Microgenomates group bacterium]
MNQFKAVLLSKQQVAEGVYRLFFCTKDGHFDFVSGQYAIVTIPGQPPLKRLYSFASSPNTQGTFELLIKIIDGGMGTQYLKNLRVGDCIDVAGPAGLFTQKKTPSRKIYMATGTGFAPIRSFFLSSPSVSLKDSFLFWGMRTIEETYLFDELYSLYTQRGLSFYYCLSKQEYLSSIPAYLLQFYRTGHIQDVWKSVLGSPDANDQYYLCGSRTVVESLRVLLLSLSVPKERVFFEKY